MRTANQIAAEMLRIHPMVFRNNVGMAMNPKTGKKFRYGLMKGSADFIGWTTLTINGYKYAVFTSIEIKTYGDTLKPAQRKWNRAVLRDGGIAEVYTEDKQGRIVVKTGEEIC
jgi:hypothetical protein